ncbi:DMT family transporter [Aeropyrum camini]|uniref:Drug/metabolite transporter superfamily permease n=1 Tax=Aeropyrum camini SY1 = JCM 12091 TaxID=1198449 RepID=U3TG72_9CREN|nr:DMT family transporter [Aeropyrum camini]BAN90319.1 drug/metabolite transporter superfamily permease [Aeropyrum camini SY1 = JCM 12091]
MPRFSGVAGLLLPALAAISWGTNAVAGRYLVGGGHIDGVTLTLVRFALATPLIGVSAFYIARDKMFNPDRSLMGWSAVLGLLGITGFNIFFYSALGHMDASITALVTALATPLTYMAAVVLGLEKATLLATAGALVSVAGTYLVLSPSPGSNVSLLGFLLAFGAALSWVVYTIILRVKLAGYDQNVVMFWTSLFGTIFTIPAYAALAPGGGLRLGPVEAALILYVAAVPGALGYTLWNLGVEKVGASKSAVFIPLVPLTAAILGWLLLGETLTIRQLVGAALIIAGIIAVVWRR